MIAVAGTRRCSSCNVQYPDEGQRRRCLICGGATWPMQSGTPSTKDELFEAYYAKWDREHDATRLEPDHEEVRRDVARAKREIAELDEKWRA